MNKQKLEIVELILGTDVDIHPQNITKETKEFISQKIRLTLKEQEAINKYKLKQQQDKKQKLDAIQTCFELMLKNHKTSTPTPIEEIIKLSDANLNSFILRLINFIKKRGNLWKIKKNTKNGKKYYSLIPS